jgi:hypothetical protein
MELISFGEVWNSDDKTLGASDAMVCCCFMLTVEQRSVTFYFVQSDWYRGWACITNAEDFLSVNRLLGAFGKLRKANRLLASSCLSISVPLRGTTRLPVDGFSWNFMFEYFSKICRGDASFIKI